MIWNRQRISLIDGRIRGLELPPQDLRKSLLYKVDGIFRGDRGRKRPPVPAFSVRSQGDSKGYFFFGFAFACCFSFFFLSAQYFFILADITLRSLADSLRLLRLRVGGFVSVLVLGVDFSPSNSALISALSPSMRCLSASSLSAASSSALSGKCL